MHDAITSEIYYTYKSDVFSGIVTMSVEGTSENTDCKDKRAEGIPMVLDGITSGIIDRVLDESLTSLTCEGEAPGTYIACHELDTDSTLTIYDVKNWGGPASGVTPVVEHIVYYEGPSGTKNPPLPPNEQRPQHKHIITK